MPSRKKKWWQTVPAIVAGITALLSAITALFVTLEKINAFRSAEKALSPDEWLSSADYQKLFNDQVNKGFYPTKFWGRLRDGREEFRGEWHSGRGPCSWQSRGQLYAGEFKRIDAGLTQEGYSLSWKSEFKNALEESVIQALWTKPCPD